MPEALESGALGLIVMNLVLAAACVALLGGIAGGVVMELLMRRRRPQVEEADPAPTRSLAELRDELPEGWPPVHEHARGRAS